MPAEPFRVGKSQRWFVCQFEKSARFADVDVPNWAQVIADQVATGARVRIGHIGSSPIVESVLVPLDEADDVDEAATIASKIAAKVGPA